MKNAYRTLRDWPPRGLARAEGRGGPHVFWFHMSVGLVWALFMFGLTLLINLCSTGALDEEGVRSSMAVYYPGGLLIGLVMWATRQSPGARRRDKRA